MAGRETLLPAATALVAATSSATILPPPKPTRLRTTSSPSTNSGSASMLSAPKHPPPPPPPVPLPRPPIVSLPTTLHGQDNKDVASKTSNHSSCSLEEARTRLRSTGTFLEGLSSSMSSSTSLPPPSVTTKPLMPSSTIHQQGTTSNALPVPPPKPKRTSQQTPLHPPAPPPAPNAKPLSLQCTNHRNTGNVPVTQPYQQSTLDDHRQSPYQGVRLPIVPRARKPSHPQQAPTGAETGVSATAQVFSTGHRRQAASGGGGGSDSTGNEGGGRPGRGLGSVQGSGTETEVTTTPGGEVIIGVQNNVHAHPNTPVPSPQHQHAPILPTHTSSLSLDGHAHSRSHSATQQTLAPLIAPNTTTASPGVPTGRPVARFGPYDKPFEPTSNGQGSDNTAASNPSLETKGLPEDLSSLEAAGASVTLLQARSRLRSTTHSSLSSSSSSSSPPATIRSQPAPCTPASHTIAAISNTALRSHHVYPPPEQPSLHPDHYQEPYLQENWDLQEDEDELALSSLSSKAEQRHRQGKSGSAGAASERRKVLIDTLEPSTPPIASYLTTTHTPSGNLPNSPSASSSPSSLAASLQKIQTMVHEQTERIRQVNYTEKKADLAEVVYEKSALWRVRGAEWGGFAKKAWVDRGGVGGLAGGIAERWRRRGDYPIGGGYNPEGQTAGHVEQIFGIPLAEAVKHSRISPSTGVPAVVTRCIEYLDVMGVEEVGLYRISGSSTTVAKMKALFDQGQDYDFLQKGHEPPNPHDVATLLKLYLRDLPAPLIPLSLLPAFTQAASSDEPGLALREQLRHLPLENYLLLAALCQHLSTLADYETVTKMGMSNLGLIFCPTLQIGSALFKQLLGGDDPLKKTSAPSGTAMAGCGDGNSHLHESARLMEGSSGKEDGHHRGGQSQQDGDGESRARREYRLAQVWADKETRHEEMENLELVKDFEMALEMQQDEEKLFQQQQHGGSDPTLAQHQHHQDQEWDRVDDFDDDALLESAKAFPSTLSASAPTVTATAAAEARSPPPLVDLYDEMMMREIDEAASTPLITPPQTIRSAPLPCVSGRPHQPHQPRRYHAREPAAVLDQSIGTSMGRPLASSGGNKGHAREERKDEQESDEDDDRVGEDGPNARMSRSLHSGVEHPSSSGPGLEDARRRRSRPPPTFLAGVGMALPSSSPPPSSMTATTGSILPSTFAGQASNRRMNGGHGGHSSYGDNPKHQSSSVNSGVASSTSTTSSSLPSSRSMNNRGSGSPSTSFSTATSTTITVPNAAVSTSSSSSAATAAVFQDLFARPAQPTVSREDARGTKVKRMVNPFENMVASSPSFATTPTGIPGAPAPPPLLPLGSSLPSPSYGEVNEYVQQLQLHEEDNIRSTLDSSARHRRQPAGFERVGGGAGQR